MKMALDFSMKEPRIVERQSSAFVNAIRVHTALTAKVERRLLIWMAHRVPARMGPDHLTALALASQLLAGVAYAVSSWNEYLLWLVNGLLILNWLGDSLDGTLARVRNQQRPRYGFYVDHIADTLGAFALIAGLASSGYVRWEIAAGMLVCFYALSIESYLATYTTGRFHLSHGLFGPTEIRILLCAGNACLFFRPYVIIGHQRVLLFDIGVVAIAGMTFMFLSAAIRHTRLLYKEEALP
jgi:phosphatidylglycerophosphate synthase